MKPVRYYDLAVKLTVCLCFGSIAMAVLMCFCIGFGLHSTVGKEALYLCRVILGASLWLCLRRERVLEQRLEQLPPRAKPMRVLRVLALGLWGLSTVLLLLSLVLAICRLGYGSFWVKYPCAIGAAAMPAGWLGLMVCFRRRRLAIECAAKAVRG